MGTVPAIRADSVGKRFRLFASRRDRLVEAIHPLRRSFHEPFWALRDLSFEIPSGQAVGIVGRNGSGKSTLLQIIAGVMQANTGAVSVSGRVSALLQLGAGFNPEFSGRENALLNGVLLGMPEAEMRERIPEIESFAELGRFFDQPVGTYSSGMFLRLGFAVAMSVRADILVVDEAIAVGDAAFRFKCFEKIREFRAAGGTLVLVSHEKELMLRHCERGILLDQGRVIMDGPINDVLNHYDRIRFDRRTRATVVAEAEPATPGSVGLDTCAHYIREHFHAGDGRAQLIELELLHESGARVDKVRPGDRLHLRAEYRVNAEIAAAQFGFAICASDGLTLYGRAGDRLGSEPTRLRARSRVVVEYTFDLPLLPGPYFINLGLFESAHGDLSYIDNRRGVMRIEVSGDCRVAGMVEVNCQMRLCQGGA